MEPVNKRSRMTNPLFNVFWMKGRHTSGIDEMIQWLRYEWSVVMVMNAAVLRDVTPRHNVHDVYLFFSSVNVPDSNLFLSLMRQRAFCLSRSFVDFNLESLAVRLNFRLAVTYTNRRSEPNVMEHHESRPFHSNTGGCALLVLGPK